MSGAAEPDQGVGNRDRGLQLQPGADPREAEIAPMNLKILYYILGDVLFFVFAYQCQSPLPLDTFWIRYWLQQT